MRSAPEEDDDDADTAQRGDEVDPFGQNVSKIVQPVSETTIGLRQAPSPPPQPAAPARCPGPLPRPAQRAPCDTPIPLYRQREPEPPFLVANLDSSSSNFRNFASVLVTI